MSSNVLVSLLKPVVLFDKVKVLPANNDSLVHLGGDNHTRENTATDGDIRSERALLVDVGSFDGSLGSLEAKANVFVPTLRGSKLWLDALVDKGDSTLLLKGFFSLRR